MSLFLLQKGFSFSFPGGARRAASGVRTPQPPLRRFSHPASITSFILLAAARLKFFDRILILVLRLNGFIISLSPLFSFLNCFLFLFRSEYRRWWWANPLGMGLVFYGTYKVWHMTYMVRKQKKSTFELFASPASRNSLFSSPLSPKTKT